MGTPAVVCMFHCDRDMAAGACAESGVAVKQGAGPLVDPTPEAGQQNLTAVSFESPFFALHYKCTSARSPCRLGQQVCCVSAAAHQAWHPTDALPCMPGCARYYLLQRRDMITRHQFALHLIADSTVIPNYLSLNPSSHTKQQHPGPRYYALMPSTPAVAPQWALQTSPFEIASSRYHTHEQNTASQLQHTSSRVGLHVVSSLEHT